MHKSGKIPECICVFAAVFGYLELAMGSMSYLQIACNADLVLQYHSGNLNLRQK
jgi:hypothetical protein